jgi:D-3-phosphoglycerate dehydrogenase
MPATGNRKVVVLHKNLPSLIAGITSVLSGRGINIENMTNKSRGDNACTLLEIADGKFAGLEDEISASISAIQGVLRVRFI